MDSKIVMINDANGNPRKLVYKYVRITIEDIINHVVHYIFQEIREYQNSNQMYQSPKNHT